MKDDSSLDPVSARLLGYVADDWLDNWGFVGTVLHHTPLPGIPEAIERSLEIAERLMRAGLLVAGELETDGFHAWDLDVDGVMERLRQEWTTGPADFRDRPLMYFDVTPEGQRLGEAEWDDPAT